MDKLEDSLKKLSLEGIILIQGLLAQRALEIISENKPDVDAIIKPSSIIV